MPVLVITLSRPLYRARHTLHADSTIAPPSHQTSEANYLCFFAHSVKLPRALGVNLAVVLVLEKERILFIMTRLLTRSLMYTLVAITA
jgi:hypothetical protein